jgi:type III pantothenate kinase
LSSTAIDIVLSSVVPAETRLMYPLIKLLGRRILRVHHRLNLGIDFAVDAPEAVGSDRIANIVAAKSLVDKTAVVVDCGSATTLSFLSEGVFLGGAILPGIRMMRDTLKQQTAKLPAAPLLAPHHAIGSNTKAAIQSGIMLGTISAINGIINLAERERQLHFPIVLTGGHASYLHELFPKPVIVRHDLTMQGLRLIFLNNFS